MTTTAILVLNREEGRTILAEGNPEIAKRFSIWLTVLPSTLRPEVAVRCPFCADATGALYAVGEEDGDPAVYHEAGPFSPCAEWESSELVEFLEKARLRMSE